MKLPNDAVMLLSVINTALRDKYNSLEDMADSEGFNAGEVIEKLSTIDYRYDKKLNKFV